MRVRLTDFSMAYDDSRKETTAGGGIPLLFIHGYPLNCTMWQPQLAGLGDVARVIAPDLRGFGESEATPGPYSMDLLADDCAALLDQLSITEPVVVCGLSMGGYVAFAFYRKYPQRVRALILTATRAGADSLEAQANRDRSAALAEKEGATAIARMMLPKMLSPKTYTHRPELVEQVRNILESASVTGIIGALKGMRDRPDSTPTLAQIVHPTWLIFGEDDQFVPRQEIEAMQAAIKGSTLHILPDAGHLPNLEQPEMFNVVVREFIRLL